MLLFWWRALALFLLPEYPTLTSLACMYDTPTHSFYPSCFLSQVHASQQPGIQILPDPGLSDLRINVPYVQSLWPTEIEFWVPPTMPMRQGVYQSREFTGPANAPINVHIDSHRATDRGRNEDNQLSIFAPLGSHG